MQFPKYCFCYECGAPITDDGWTCAHGVIDGRKFRFKIPQRFVIASLVTEPLEPPQPAD